jgi:tripartite-type tricarboxylate transporter receptor subunit TctC
MLLRLFALGSLSISITLAGFPKLADANQCERRLPSRLSLIVNAKAGGTPDTYIRALAASLKKVSKLNPIVSNIEQGNLTAISRISAGTDNSLVIGILSSALMNPEFRKSGSKYNVTEFDPLAGFDSGHAVWVVKGGRSIDEFFKKNVVIATNNIADEAIPGGMVAQALGIDVSFATGYTGSADRYASLLRGETDVNPTNALSASRVLAGGKFSVALAISRGAHPNHLNAPFLIGPGGLITQKDGSERYQIAEAAVLLSRKISFVLISKNISPAIRTCLSAIIDEAVEHPAFKQRLELEKNDILVLTSTTAKSTFEEITARFLEHQNKIQKLQKNNEK